MKGKLSVGSGWGKSWGHFLNGSTYEEKMNRRPQLCSLDLPRPPSQTTRAETAGVLGDHSADRQAAPPPPRPALHRRPAFGLLHPPAPLCPRPHCTSHRHYELRPHHRSNLIHPTNVRLCLNSKRLLPSISGKKVDTYFNSHRLLYSFFSNFTVLLLIL